MLRMENYQLTLVRGRWELKTEGGPPVATYDTRVNAVLAARRVAAMETGSLTIFNADGSVEEKRAYPAVVALPIR
jgi:hypothetical protein